MLLLERIKTGTLLIQDKHPLHTRTVNTLTIAETTAVKECQAQPPSGLTILTHHHRETIII